LHIHSVLLSPARHSWQSFKVPDCCLPFFQKVQEAPFELAHDFFIAQSRSLKSEALRQAHWQRAPPPFCTGNAQLTDGIKAPSTMAVMSNFIGRLLSMHCIPHARRAGTCPRQQVRQITCQRSGNGLSAIQSRRARQPVNGSDARAVTMRSQGTPFRPSA
jgi:hypothetical protein